MRDFLAAICFILALLSLLYAFIGLAYPGIVTPKGKRPPSRLVAFIRGIAGLVFLMVVGALVATPIKDSGQGQPLQAIPDKNAIAESQAKPLVAETPSNESPPIANPLPAADDDRSTQSTRPSLSAVIADDLPAMTDTTNELSPGAANLAIWAAKSNLQWKELISIPKTKAPLVMKDSDQERGKLICTSGQIIEITADDAAGNKLFEGEIGDDQTGTIYRFIAVRSTGSLVEQSHASFCGIVIGKFDYTNSMSGATHAIQLVGMFKLPENMR